MDENIQSACAFQAVSCLRYLKLLSLQGKSIQLLSSWTCGIYSCSLWMEQEHTQWYVCIWFMRGKRPINIKNLKTYNGIIFPSYFSCLPCPPARKSRSKQQNAWFKVGLHNHCHLAVLYLHSHRCHSPQRHWYSKQAVLLSERGEVLSESVVGPLLFPLFIYTLASDCYFPHNKIVPAPLELSE